MTFRPDRIYLSPPHMNGKEIMYIREALNTNWIAPVGPHVDAFEREFAKYVEMPHALALVSGTAALHLCMRLLDIGPGDRVCCSDLTFAASASAIRYEGADPVFIDAGETTWNMSPAALEQALSEAEQTGRLPKAVVVVDLYGQSADYKTITQLCTRYNIPLIEDAAESLGATYNGGKCGTFGDLNVFSFNGNKIITTSGGGMLVSANEAHIEQAWFLATQARDPALHYEHSQLGYNYRLSNILAGIGRGQLQVLEDRIDVRRLIFQRYYHALSDYDGIEFMPEASDGRSTRWLTALTVDPEHTGVTRTQIIQALEAENIEARPVWKPMHLQPLYEEYDYYTADGRSVSEALFTDGLCLPSGSNLSESDQERVIRVIQSQLEQ